MAIIRDVLAVGLYLPTIAWFGFYLGLRCRSQAQAIVVAVTLLTVICVVPVAAAWLLTLRADPYGIQDPRNHVWLGALVYLSPAAMLTTIPRDGFDTVLAVVHFVAAGAIYRGLAYRSRKEFAKRVGRNDGIFVDDEEEEIPLVALSVEDRMVRLRRGRIGM